MNSNKILSQIARIASVIFHPLIIPTLGFLLLFNSGFYFTLLPWNIKRFLLLVIFLSTCVLPALSILLLAFNRKLDLNMDKNTDRILPLILSSIFYYVGYLILRRLPIFPIFNFFLIASIMVQIALIFITLRWKISAHSAAIGGLLGGFFALSFRLDENPMLILISLILISGIVGSARLILGKHSTWQVYSGFLLGLIIMNLVILFI